MGFNLCYLGLERRGAFGWAVDDRHFAVVACLDVLHRLAPGDTAPTLRVLPAALPAGTYRLRTEVSAGEGARGTVRTQPFTVRR